MKAESKTSERRFTAQEMREAASTCETVEVADQFYSVEMDRAAAMLRYAADAVERLDAVVKVAKEKFDDIYNSPMCWDEDENEFHSLEQLKEMDALEVIVATARGETVEDKE